MPKPVFYESWHPPFAPWTGYAIPRDLKPDGCPQMQAAERTGRTALRTKIWPGDWVYDGDRRQGKDRAELLLDPRTLGPDFGEGTGWWYRWWFWIPADFPFEDGTWQIFGQFHEQAAPGEPHPTSSPPVSIRLVRPPAGGLALRVARQAASASEWADLEVAPELWTPVDLRIYWHRGPEGFVQAAGPIGGVQHLAGPTLPENGIPPMIRFGVYRGHHHQETAWVDQGPFSIAYRQEDLAW